MHTLSQLVLRLHLLIGVQLIYQVRSIITSHERHNLAVLEYITTRARVGAPPQALSEPCP